MNKKTPTEKIRTGVRNLDEILFGGIPEGSLTVLAGTPGSGKTILSQQFIFENATREKKALFFGTLSEPLAKTLKYLEQFDFFNVKKLEEEAIQFIDLGGILHGSGLEKAVQALLENLKRFSPAFVVIDSFKAFEDLSHSDENLRKFSYEVAVQLMSWETTALLLGEFNQKDIETNPLFSIADGLLRLTDRSESGEQQRFIQVCKMRGTNHSRDEHPFTVSEAGLSVYAPRVTIRRDLQPDLHVNGNGPKRGKVGISKLDNLLGNGIPYGSSLLISGVAGTGKTLLSLEFIYRGASVFNEKGIYISFEETAERLHADARSMGWDLEKEVERGYVEIIFIPQTDILVEKHLLMIHDHLKSTGAKRIAVDSISIFFHKIKDEQIASEKLFQLATLVQMNQAIGFFATDIPYGINRISRFGVEETVVDGVILLSAVEKGLDRDRYLEVYKLRNTAHVGGRHPMKIGATGIMIKPRKKIAGAK
jgi:circadian clock protein KaiC